MECNVICALWRLCEMNVIEKCPLHKVPTMLNLLQANISDTFSVVNQYHGELRNVSALWIYFLVY